MASLYYAVFEAVGRIVLDEPIQENKVAISATSAQSATITGTGNKMQYVRLFADTNCFVTWGDDPTALTDGSEGRPLQAGVQDYVGVKAGQKLAVIQRT